MADVRLLLEDGTHERRQARIDVGHLLEFVEVHDDALPLLGRAARPGSSSSRSIVASMSSAAWAAEKLKPNVPPAGSYVITGFTRRESKTLSAASLALNIGEASVVVDRAREVRGEPLLRRGLHEVNLRDQDSVPQELL